MIGTSPNAPADWAGLCWLRKPFAFLFEDIEGMTAIEYSLIGALVAVVLTYAYLSLAGNLNHLFTTVANSI